MVKLNTRLKTLALGFAVLTSTSISIALAADTNLPATTNLDQKPKHEWGHHKGHRKGCGAMKQLGLSEEQKTRLKDAHKAFREQNASAFESLKAKYQQLHQLGKDPSTEAQRKQLHDEIKQERKALNVKREAAMKGILTPEQESRWQELKQACKAKHSLKHEDKTKTN